MIRERIVAIAAHLLEAAPEDIELSGSRASVRGALKQGISLAEIASLVYFQPDELPPGVPPELEATGRYKTSGGSVWTNASHVCTCEVDLDTGQVKLLRYIVAEDCGAMINPNVVEGQIAGGSVQGMAGVLFEHLAYDEDGNPLATTFMDYLVPTATEIPTIEYGHVETPSIGARRLQGRGRGRRAGLGPGRGHGGGRRAGAARRDGGSPAPLAGQRPGPGGSRAGAPEHPAHAGARCPPAAAQRGEPSRSASSSRSASRWMRVAFITMASSA